MIVFTILQSLVIICSFVYTTRRLKNCEPISWRVRKGMKCYSCLENMGSDQELSSRLFSDAEEFRLCQRCERDERLDSTLGIRKTTYINRFKKFCHSDKSHRSTIYLAIALFACLVISLFFRGSNIFAPISFLVNLVYWGFFAYRSKIAFERKEADK